MGSGALKGAERTAVAELRPMIAFDPWDSDDSVHASVPGTVRALHSAVEQAPSHRVSTDSLVETSVALDHPVVDQAHSFGATLDRSSQPQLDVRPAAVWQLLGLPVPVEEVALTTLERSHPTVWRRPGSGVDPDVTCQPPPVGTLALAAVLPATVHRQGTGDTHEAQPEAAPPDRAARETTAEANARDTHYMKGEIASPQSPPQSPQQAGAPRLSRGRSTSGASPQWRVFRSRLEFQAAWELECWKQGEMNAFLARLQVRSLARKVKI